MYRLDVYNYSTKLNQFSDIITLESALKVNAVGWIRFTISADHPVIPDLIKYNIIKLYRQNSIFTWYLENVGIITKLVYSYDQSNHQLLTVTAMHPNWLLSTRINNFYPIVSNKSSFVSQKGEFISKQLVKYNLTSYATEANGRLRDGTSTIQPITIQADSGNGHSITIHCAYTNILTLLQKIAVTGGGDFNMVDAGTSYIFTWYLSQLGTDRHASVFFSVDRGNIANPTYTIDYTEEKTALIIGGLGELDQRNIVILASSDFSDVNDKEDFYPSYTEDDNSLTAQGYKHLALHKAIKALTFQVIQIPSSSYGTHYFLGDLVSITNPYTGLSTTSKIVQAQINISQTSGEKITFDLTDTPIINDDIDTTDRALIANGIDGGAF